MGGIIEGDIKKALGMGEMEIGGVKIRLNLTTAKDLIEFQYLPIEYLKSENPTLAETAELQKAYSKYFINYLKDKAPDMDINDIELFVTKYLNQFIEKFPVATGMRTEKEIKEYKESLKNKEKKL